MTEGTDKTAAAAAESQVEGQPPAAADAQPQPGSETHVESPTPQPSSPPPHVNGGGADDAEPPQSVAAEPEVSPLAESAVQPVPEIPQGNGELVLVTDALSFVGAHVVSQLIQSGQFRVRAAVSDVADEAKVGAVKSLCPAEAKHPLDVVEAGSAAKPETWEAALKDCEFVISTGHLSGVASADEAAVQAAVDAALAVLKASHATKTVKRVVLTSSISAITQGHGDSKKKFTEEDWSEAEKILDSQAKIETLVEKAAWAFVKDLPDNERFELVAINPGYVLGPPLVPSSDSDATEVVRRLLNRDDRMLPKLNFNVVDVRDVALAHVRALTLPVAGARHILVSHNVWLRDIAVILAKEFKRQGFSVPTTQAPYLVLWMKAQFDPSVKSILPLVNHLHETDTKRMKEALYIQPRDLKETVIDTASSLIEKDVVKKVEKKPSRRFSLRRSKKETGKPDEPKPADGEPQAPAADASAAEAPPSAGAATEGGGGASEKGEKKKKAASPKKKSDKKKKGAAAAAEEVAAAAAAEDVASAEAPPAEAATIHQQSEESPPPPSASVAGEAPAAGEQPSAEQQQHAGTPNGDVCKEAKVDEVAAAPASSPAAESVAEPTTAAPSADVEAPSDCAESAGATVAAETAAAEPEAVDAASAAAAQEEPATVTAC